MLRNEEQLKEAVHAWFVKAEEDFLKEVLGDAAPETQADMPKELVERKDPRAARQAAKDKKDTIAIHNFLKKSMCVDASLMGYKYLSDALLMCHRSYNCLQNITTILYPGIAEKNDSTAVRIDRALRHAIKQSWNEVDEKLIQEVFGKSFSKRKIPSNSQYIAYLLDYMVEKNILD